MENLILLLIESEKRLMRVTEIFFIRQLDGQIINKPLCATEYILIKVCHR